MAVDLAYNFAAHDLVVSPNKGVELRAGETTFDQRIRLRLLIPRGQWALDPSLGSLGSNLIDATRMPMWRALTEIPLLIHEGLEPMEDINVTDVLVTQNNDSPSAIDIEIRYAILGEEGDDLSEVLVSEFTIAG